MGYVITVHTPPPEPSINYVTENPGAGSWRAGTYKLAFVGTDSNSNTRSYGTLTMWSPVVFYEITIAENSGIDYSVTMDPSAPYIYALIKSIDGGLNDGEWLNPTPGNTYPHTTYTSGTFTGFRHNSVIWTSHPLRFEQFNDKPYGLSLTNGIGMIDVSSDGAGGTVLLSDIIQAVRDSSLENGVDYIDAGDQSLMVNCSLDLYNDDYGTLNINNCSIYCYGIYNENSSLEITGYTQGTTGTWNTIQIPAVEAVYDFHKTSYLGTVILRDTVITGFGENGNDHVFSLGSDASIKNCYIDGVLFPAAMGNPFTYISNSLVRTRIAINTFNHGDVLRDNTYEAASLLCDKQISIQNMTIYHKWPGYLFLLYPVRDISTEILDCTFYNQTSYLDSAYLDAPVDYSFVMESVNAYTYANTDPSTRASLDFKQTIDYTIIDNNGNYIENANIVCVDVSGNTSFDVYTDASGNISQKLLVYQAATHYGGTPSGYLANPIIAAGQSYNPFSFTISKSGYETLTFTKSITSKETNTFILSDSGTIEYKDRVILFS